MAGSASAPKDERKAYLYEVQGLRTFAALLVAIYHIWLQRVSGGVDVFFVVAAYFMTQSFLRKDRVSVAVVRDYYISTMRRVLPSMTLVVVATIAMALLFMPKVLWKGEIADAAGSTLFVENWVLARSGSNYLNQGLTSSVFQQMWALSLQVQMYVSMPILLLIGDHVARSSGLSRRLSAFILTGVAILVSFVFGLHAIAHDQQSAYFNTFARVWEFGFGMWIAIMGSRVVLAKPLAKGIGIAAVIALVSFPMVVNVSASFPGFAALVPVGCAAAIIIAALNKGDVPVLTWKPLVWAGDYSFAFYLWHWPLLMLTRYGLKSDEVGYYGLAIIVAAAGLAYVTTRFVETPFRKSPRLTGRPVVASIACAALLATPAAASAAWFQTYRHGVAKAKADLGRYLNDPGAAHSGKGLVPALILVKSDVPSGYSDGCHQNEVNDALIQCEAGNPRSDTVVVAVGGSHTLQWVPVLKEIAARQGFKLIIMTKAACMLTMGGGNHEMKRPGPCIRWNQRVMKEIERVHPAFVLTTSTRNVGRTDEEKIEGVPKGYVMAWEALAKQGITLIGMRDNPWFRSDIPYCVETHLADPNVCGYRRQDFYQPTDPAIAVAPAGMKLLDYSDHFCPDGFCSPVQARALLYRDAHHFTVTYTRQHKDRLDQDLAAIISSRN